MLNPHGPSAASIASLTWLLFGTAGVVFVIVVIYLLIAIFRRRQSATNSADNTNTTTSPQLAARNERRTLTFVIIAGGVIPAIVLTILMGISVYSENALAAVPTSTTGSTPYTIEIIGHDWWWEIHYLDQGITTANEIHVPAGQPVLLKLTSADVIHDFWVPQLSQKQDMIPGQTVTTWLQADQVGTYKGECSEYCGPDHAQMNFVLVADKPEDFTRWIKAQQQIPAEPVDSALKQGQQVFLGSSCVYCHMVSGTNASGNLGPDLTHFGSRLTIGAGILDNNSGNLAGWIANAQAIKPGNKMPPMDLTGDELQSVIAYLESLK